MSILQELWALKEAENLNFDVEKEKDKQKNQPPKPGEKKPEGETDAEANGQEGGQDNEHDKDGKDTLVQMFADADEKDELKVYVNQATYQVKQALEDEEVKINWPGQSATTKRATAEEYIVRNPEQLQKMKVIEKDELEKDYEQVNPNEKPDAEGYVIYRSKKEVLAFQYNEKELLQINVGGHQIKISPEDYIGHPISNPKKLLIISKADFEKKYRLS